MNEVMTKENIKIENMIFEVRGKQVIMDSDVATLFNYETKYLNRQVQRNINRFPENYCFQLTEEEYNSLRCQNVTLKTRRGEHRKYLPYVFTEYGITMLTGLLKSDIAVKVSIRIVDAFIAMRKFISNELLEQKHINKMVYNLDERVSLLETTFSKFDTFSNELFFDGQIYDAHSLLLDIFNSAKDSIVIIDNYVSKELLDVLSKTNKQVTVYTKNIDSNLINKYQSQYNNLTIYINDKFHDRFIIIDNEVLYHCGASFKDLGKKCFAINKIVSKDILNDLKSKL